MLERLNGIGAFRPRHLQPSRKQDTPYFGVTSYEELLLHREPVVKLTATQTRILAIINEISQAQDLTNLPQYFKVMRTPEYGHILSILHQDEKQTMRNRFHTPFTDLYLHVMPNASAQSELLNQLAQMIRKPHNAEVLKNAITALTDIYFYVLRPGGEAFTPDRQATHGQSLKRQQQVLTLFNTILTDVFVPLKTRRLLKNELICGQCDVVRKDWPVVRPEPMNEILYNLNHQINPLTQAYIPSYPPRRLVSPTVAEKLKNAIRTGSVSEIMALMKHPELQALMPDWQRAFGANRYQHGAQDFPLGQHLIKVFRATRASQYYQKLTPEEQFRTSTAALFHDIAKLTGPKNFREANRIMFDVHHPWRSAETVLDILPELGYTREEIDDIYFLVQRHQNLGGFVNPKVQNTPERTLEVARRIQTVPRLKMLQTLTEGDIRSVKRDIPGRTWFTPVAAETLETNCQKIEALLGAE